MLRLLLFLVIAAAIIYGVVWLLQRAREGIAGHSAPPAPRPAPDDDPVFLAQLDRRLRDERLAREAREAREKRAAREQHAAGEQREATSTGPGNPADRGVDPVLDADDEAPAGASGGTVGGGSDGPASGQPGGADRPRGGSDREPGGQPGGSDPLRGGQPGGSDRPRGGQHGTAAEPERRPGLDPNDPPRP